MPTCESCGADLDDLPTRCPSCGAFNEPDPPLTKRLLPSPTATTPVGVGALAVVEAFGMLWGTITVLSLLAVVSALAPLGQLAVYAAALFLVANAVKLYGLWLVRPWSWLLAMGLYAVAAVAAAALLAQGERRPGVVLGWAILGLAYLYRKRGAYRGDASGPEGSR